MVGVKRWDRIRSEEIRRRARILSKGRWIEVLRLFRHMERMEEGHWPRKGKAAY